MLAHQDPSQVVRLADALRARQPTAEVAVAYNGPLEHAESDDLIAAGVRRVGSGHRARWGEFSIVERTLEGLADIDGDRSVVLISADSHPTPHLGAWVRTFAASGSHVALHGSEVVGNQMLDAQVGHRWHLWHQPRSDAGRALFRVTNVIGGWLGRRERVRVSPRVVAIAGRRRAVPPRYAKGDQWFAISPEGRARLQVRMADPLLRDLFARTLIPDEFLFHTVALLDGWRIWQSKLMFLAWPYSGAPNPRHLGLDDLPAVLEASTPFARKLRGPSGEELARALDQLPDRQLAPALDGPLVQGASGAPDGAADDER